MAEIDDFLPSVLAQHLAEGERVGFAGYVMRPLKLNALKVPEAYDHGWLAVATQTRLLLFKTKGQGTMGRRPQPLAESVVEWSYHDLEEVVLGNISGITTGKWFYVRPHPGLGPFPPKIYGDEESWGARYDFYPTCDNWDAHANFFAGFGPWLSGQVAAGAFPLDAARGAKVAAHKAKRDAETAERLRLAEEARQRRAEAMAKAGAGLRKLFGGFKGPPIWIVLALVLTLGSLGSCGMSGYQHFDRIPSHEGFIRRAQEPVPDFYNEHERKRQQDKNASLLSERSEKLSSSKTMRWLYLLFSWVLLGAGVGVLVLKRGASGGAPSEAAPEPANTAPGPPPGAPPGPPPGAPPAPGPPPGAPPSPPRAPGPPPPPA